MRPLAHRKSAQRIGRTIFSKGKAIKICGRQIAMAKEGIRGSLVAVEWRGEGWVMDSKGKKTADHRGRESQTKQGQVWGWRELKL